MSLPGAHSSRKGEPSNILVYCLGDKNFAYFKTSEPERWRFSLRVSPELYLGLTDQPGIKPAKYMGRFHWVTVVDITLMEETYLKDLVLGSYQMIYNRLSKKAQTELSAE